ncbi:penicillin-binding protein 2 [Sediminibacterium soli]|uniref:penicillin-binding protein 2 n=1 Tax=Sediminibacterium soli TaxID=2698829 RepID=UPI00137B6B1A|nr:penicillin-binding protein 2 [Sediminibacterium soli]NCI47577.1 penicillin-binding protein 2 [Sediminibacterium soli]
MPVFNQSRRRVIQIIFAAVFLVIAGQLVNLQVFSAKYKLAAENNAVLRKVIYPDRGIIFDRKRKAILENTISYDLMVTPSDAKGVDTFALCGLLNIDTAEFKKRMRELTFKNGWVKQSAFQSLLSPEMYARLNENIYKYNGFTLMERSVRTYPYGVAGHLLGYVREVDTGYLRRHDGEGYQQGDYAGRTGLEATYEKVLMGQRGVKNYIRDNKSRIQGSYENGVYDTTAIAGKNIYTSVDVDLQKLGEKLMSNKVGSIVAIDPRTGGILCMISAPTYDPNYLTGTDQRKHFAEMSLDPRQPFNNRGLGTYYSPGSTFKTVVGIIGLTEGVIDERTTVSCPGYFTGCGNGKPKCLDKGVFNFTNAVAHSDNSYFSTVYKRFLEQRKFPNTDSALSAFKAYAASFGLGGKLGVDLPAEKQGLIPLADNYHKEFGPRIYPCNLISNAIGQGKVLTTLAQLANVMAIIANRGWYYTPHLVDSIEGNDEYDMLAPYKTKHYTDKRIPDSIYTAVQDGMQAVVEYGTAVRSKIPDIVFCGKTGTVENYAKVNGVVKKQPDHSFFGAFAPRNNPKIAIAVIVENSDQGARVAAPIASLLIEKYLKDSIRGPERKAMEEEYTKRVYIPPYMQVLINQRDSLKRARAAEKLLEEERKQSEETESDSTTSQELIQPEDADRPARKAPAPVKPKPLKQAVAMLQTEEKKYKRAK